MSRSTVRSPSAEVGLRLERTYGVLAVLLLVIAIIVSLAFCAFLFPSKAYGQGIPKVCLDYADKQQRAAGALKMSPDKQKDAWAQGVIACMEAYDKKFGTLDNKDADIKQLESSYECACSGTPRKQYEREYCEKRKLELDMLHQARKPSQQ